MTKLFVKCVLFIVAILATFGTNVKSQSQNCPDMMCTEPGQCCSEDMMMCIDCIKN